MTTRFVATVGAALVVGVAAAGDPSPTDDAARRAEIAKLGRLAWIDREGRVSTSDLAGEDRVVSDVAHADWVGWLGDGRRVAALALSRVLVIDASTGKATDVTADAKPEEKFTAYTPAVSPDGRRLAVWRCDVGKSRATVSGWLAVVGLDVIDLDAGTRVDFPSSGPWRGVDGSAARWSMPPSAWWTADGATLYAAVGVESQSLVRCAADGSGAKSIASVAPKRWITQVAPDGPSVALAVEDLRRLEIRDASGKTLLLLDTPSRCWKLAWSDDRKSLIADVSAPDAPIERWTIEPGRPASRTSSFDDGVHVPAVDPKWTILSRRPDDAGGVWHLWCQTIATEQSVKIGLGRDARALGALVVFLRHRDKSGSDLWAFDPQDGASIRLTERPIDAQRYDVFVTPPASRGR